MMESPFKNDPFAIVWQAFKNLYPDKPCECWITEKENENAENAAEYGYTNFPNDCGNPIVCIYADYPIKQQIEILAHELAHVAAGINSNHGPEWEAAFDAILKEYENILYTMQEDGIL